MEFFSWAQKINRNRFYTEILSKCWRICLFTRKRARNCNIRQTFVNKRKNLRPKSCKLYCRIWESSDGNVEGIGRRRIRGPDEKVRSRCSKIYSTVEWRRKIRVQLYWLMFWRSFNKILKITSKNGKISL